MTLTKTLPLLLLMALATPVFAQTATEGDAATTTDPPADPLALAMGEEDAADSKVGDIYVDGEFGDWEIRCIKSEPPAPDLCQMYQLLLDPNDSPVAEINIFPLKAASADQPAAGATVITPLESLLTQQLGLSVDGGKVRKYPYSWCSRIGCFSRMGFSQAEIDQFRRGNAAALVIVPVAAPDQKVSLKVSLTGFTAAYNDVVARQQ